MRNGCPVVGVTRGEDDVEQLPLLVDHQMERKTKEPVHRSLPTCGQRTENPVGGNAAVVAYL